MSEQSLAFEELSRVVGDLVEMVGDLYLTDPRTTNVDRQDFRDKIAEIDKATDRLQKAVGL